MNIDLFDFELPDAAIAQEPLTPRDQARLLVLRRDSGGIEHRHVHDLPQLLGRGDLLIVNRTRVFPGRLLGRRPTGGAVEVLLVRRLAPCRWEALVRPGRRLRRGDVVHVGNAALWIESESLEPDFRRTVRLDLPPEQEAAWLDANGETPLPPYIRRRATLEDRGRYQTVYARESGSVAAPTAGLHFTPELLERLRDGGVERGEVILHVGPGTFRPVQVEDVREHRVHAEPFSIPQDTVDAVQRARLRGDRVVCVGTTTVRALESAAAGPPPLRAVTGETDLVIVPGFEFRVTDALLTNFHLPRSSLLLLVCAFAGRERVLAAYREAVSAGYRFYSYGDAMLIL